MVNLTVSTKTEEYTQLYQDMTGPYATGADRQAAAGAIDWDIARNTAKARLAKRGLDREPTEAEVSRIFYSM